MKLIKTNESVTRSYDAEGNASDRVDSINYDLRDDDGNTVGSATVDNSRAHFSGNIYSYSDIGEGEQKLRETLGIE